MSKVSKISKFYNPSLSTEENAALCGCSVANVRKYIETNGIDRRFDNKLTQWRKINEYSDKHPTVSVHCIAKVFNISPTTVRKYLGAPMPTQQDKTKVSKLDLSKYSNLLTSVGSSDECLYRIGKLYLNSGGVDVDLTYSVGGIWLNCGLPQPLMKFDKYPQTSDTLPLDDIDKHVTHNSVRSVVFDLPFWYGEKRKDMKMSERFNQFSSEKELIDTNVAMLELANKILMKNGILLVKTMDIQTHGKTTWIRDLIVTIATDLGLVKIDELIYLNKSKLGLSATSKQQHCVRKAHGYWLVFKKKRTAKAVVVDSCRVRFDEKTMKVA